MQAFYAGVTTPLRLLTMLSYVSGGFTASATKLYAVAYSDDAEWGCLCHADTTLKIAFLALKSQKWGMSHSFKWAGASAWRG